MIGTRTGGAASGTGGIAAVVKVPWVLLVIPAEEVATTRNEYAVLGVRPVIGSSTA